MLGIYDMLDFNTRTEIGLATVIISITWINISVVTNECALHACQGITCIDSYLVLILNSDSLTKD